MPHHLLLALVSLCLVFRALAAAHEPSYTITLFNVPGVIPTAATGINALGRIVGTYADANHLSRGFLFARGTFTFLDPPGSDLTQVTGINDRSQVVGYYRDTSADNKVRGFLFDAGHFTVIDVPEAGFLEPQAINVLGQIVGVTGITQIVGFLATPTRP